MSQMSRTCSWKVRGFLGVFRDLRFNQHPRRVLGDRAFRNMGVTDGAALMLSARTREARNPFQLPSASPLAVTEHQGGLKWKCCWKMF